MGARCMAAVIAATLLMACGSREPNDVNRPRVEPAQTLSFDGHTSATPWVAADGNLVVVAWGVTNDVGTSVALALSRDGGRTFGAPQLVPGSEGARLGGEFPPRVDTRHVEGRDEIAVTWTAGDLSRILTARSIDGGRTFTRAVELQRADAQGRRGWPALALDPSGASHIIWLDHRGLAGDGSGHTHDSATPNTDGAARALKSSLYYASVDGGAVPEQEIAPAVCYCCKTAVAATVDGAVYAAWRHVYPGNLRDIAFAVLRGAGNASPSVNAASPVRVSEDGWQIDGCPDDGPAMAVDAAGRAYVVWPTVVDGPEPRGALFLTWTDDGRTFSPRIEVPTLGSVRPSHPQLAIDAAGRIVVAWDEHLDGRRVAAAREVRMSADDGVGFGEVLDLAPGDAGYYPVVAPVPDGFIVVWSDASASAIGARRFTP